MRIEEIKEIIRPRARRGIRKEVKSWTQLFRIDEERNEVDSRA